MKRALWWMGIGIVATLTASAGFALVGLDVSVIPSEAAFEFGPSWNNNDTLVFFAGTPPTVNDPQLDLFRVGADGSNRRQLTDAPGRDWQPWFSPDGRTIYFSSERDGNAEIYAMLADGTSVVALTANGATNLTPFPSPNGRWLAYASDLNGNMDLYVLDLETGQTLQLTDDPAQDWLPAWSPDGTRIAFISNRQDNDDVFVLDVGGADFAEPTVVPLTNDPGVDIRVNWYNSRVLVWESDRGGNLDLYSGVLEDGSLAHIRALTRAPENDFGRPAFSPLGDRMAFGSLRFGSPQVVVADVVMPFSLALDRNRNNALDDEEILRGIQMWTSGDAVSGPGRPLSDNLMLRLIDLWTRGLALDTVL